LKSFTGGLERLGLIYPFEPHIVAALFARYDTTMRGYIDLYQIIEELLGEDYVNSAFDIDFSLAAFYMHLLSNQKLPRVYL